MNRKISWTMAAGILAAGGWVCSVHAQVPDESVKSELRIVKSIVKELFAEDNQSGTDFLSTAGDVEAYYYKGYGLVIYPPKYQESIRFTIYDNDSKKGVYHNNQKVKGPNVDSLVDVRKRNVTSAMENYLLNYAKLFTHLKDGEKVQMIYDRWVINKGYADMAALEDPQNKGTKNFRGISAEIGANELKALKSGSMNDQEFKKRIKMRYEFSSESKSSELDIMAKILKSLVQKDEKAFSNFTSVNYHRMESFGVIFECEVFGSARSIMEGSAIYWDQGEGRASYSYSTTRSGNETKYEFRGDPSPSNRLMVVQAPNAPAVISMQKKSKEEIEMDVEMKVKKLEKAKSEMGKMEKEIQKAEKQRSKAETERLRADERRLEADMKRLEAEMAKLKAELGQWDDKETKIDPREDQKVKTEEMIASIKSGIIKYGATLSGIAPDELIIVNLRIKGVNSSSHSFSVKRGVISDYEKGNLSLEDAIAKISVE